MHNYGNKTYLPSNFNTLFTPHSLIEGKLRLFNFCNIFIYSHSTRGWNKMVFKSPFQPKLFCDSVISSGINTFFLIKF